MVLVSLFLRHCLEYIILWLLCEKANSFMLVSDLKYNQSVSRLGDTLMCPRSDSNWAGGLSVESFYLPGMSELQRPHPVGLGRGLGICILRSFLEAT